MACKDFSNLVLASPCRVQQQLVSGMTHDKCNVLMGVWADEHVERGQVKASRVVGMHARLMAHTTFLCCLSLVTSIPTHQSN